MPYERTTKAVETAKLEDIKTKDAAEKAAAKRRFQINPRQTIQWIRDGSLSDLHAAMHFGGSNYHAIPNSLHLPLFEAVLHNLDNFEWYNAPGRKLLKRARHDHVWTLLHSLNSFDEKFFKRDAVVDSILQSWPTVLKWLCILTEEASDEDALSSLQTDSNSDALASLLLKLLHSPRTSDILMEENALAFAFRFWSRPDLSFVSLAYASLILAMCFSDEDEENIPKLVEVSKWALQQIMELVVSRLYFVASYAWKEPNLAFHFVGLLQIIMTGDHDRAIHHSLYLDTNNALIGVMKSSLRHWKNVTYPDLKPHMRLVDECRVTIHSILMCFPGSECIEAFKMVLRTGFLDLSLSSSMYVNPDSENCDLELDLSLSFLRVYLPRFLVYPTCTRTCLNAMQRLSASAIEAIAEGHKSYRKAWNSLQRLLCYRMASAAYLVANKPFYRCSNLNCQTIGFKSSFRKCGGCKERLYCSEECQIVAWKTQGHRALCEDIGDETCTYVHHNLSTNDYAHATMFAMAEVSRHMPDLRRLAKAEFPDIDFDDLYSSWTSQPLLPR